MKLIKSSICILILFLHLSGASEENNTKKSYKVGYQTIVYFYPESSVDKVDFSAYFSDFTIVQKIPKDLTSPSVLLNLIDVSSDNYAVPDLQYLSYFGRDISKAQALSIQNAKKALVVLTFYPMNIQSADPYRAVRESDKAVLAVAKAVNGLIWDSETRELMSAKAWKTRRVEAWADSTPLMLRQTVTHAYNHNSATRAVTLGMMKFGLPDIVVNDFSWSLNHPMGELIVLAMQAMVEGQLPTASGLNIDINQFQPSAYKDFLLSERNMQGKKQKGILLPMREAKKEEGDPDNILLEIHFDKLEGKSLAEKQEKLVTELFGKDDTVNYIKHNQQILEASKRAKRQLEALRTYFNAGLAPRETISVKAPFKTTDGGNEWMWVKISTWKGDKITGLLENQPVNVPNLQGGEIVEIELEDVFDYYHVLPDGTTKGNETGKLIQKLSK